MRYLSLLSLLSCVACATSASAPPPPSAPDTLAQIRTLIGAAPCQQTAQCQTLAIGVRACGGPEFYLAWSSSHSRAPALNELAARYKAQREAMNAASDDVSVCSLLADPGAMCRIDVAGAPGKCVLRPAGSGDPR